MTKPAPKPAMNAATLKRVREIVGQAVTLCEWMEPSGYVADALLADRHYARGVENLRDAILNALTNEFGEPRS